MERISVHGLASQINSEHDAYVFMEHLRWGDPVAPTCPHCGSDKAWFLNPENGVSRRTRTGTPSQRRVWKCGDCKKQYSVLTGTIFHGTKVPLQKWLFVVFEMMANKNGIAAREIERKYNVAAKTAWFMTQRIREAMKRDPLAPMMRGVVVSDETFVGGKRGNRHVKDRPPYFTNNPADFVPTDEPVRVQPGERGESPFDGKTAVLSLIDESTGEVRSKVIPDVTGATLRKAIAEQCDLAATTLYTDEGSGYRTLTSELAGHETVNHREDEYVRYEAGRCITTNAAEGYFSQLKRSIDGTHHHVSAKHLPRYLAEFDYRHSTRHLSDTARTVRLFGQVEGRRLTYRPLAGD